MPSFSEVAQIITAIAAIGAVIASIRNSRKILETKEAVQEIHIAINSRMDELLRVSKENSFKDRARSKDKP